jgi:arylsulfatase A-like enzyme
LNRSSCLRVACAFAIFACAALLAPLARAAGAKPNIVFVLSDDQRADCIGAAGNPNVHTPAVDRLASEGIHFRQATIHVPQCSPSRATLLTGLAPHQHGWFSNQAAEADRIEPARLQRLPMLPKLLKDAGYRTLLIGKWHLIPEPWDCGFSEIRTWPPPGGAQYENVRLAHGNSRNRTLEKGFINEIFGADPSELKSLKQQLEAWLVTESDASKQRPRKRPVDPESDSAPASRVN